MVPRASRLCSPLAGALAVLAGVLVPGGPGYGQTAFRGFWADAFHTGFKSTTQIDQMVERAVAGNYNAIVAEVLAFQDTGSGGHGAYWDSAIVPQASDISGGIDPLAYLCQRAHAEGIEVHAWLVTYRVSSTWPPSGNATLSGHPEWLMVPSADMGSIAKVGSYYTLDPGSPDVQEYLISIVRELVTKYEIDGINWDYIRYTQTDAGYPSDTNYLYSSWARWQRIGGGWDDFRRRTISELIRRCRAEIPAIRSNPRQPLRQTADIFATGDAPSNFSSTSAYNLFQNWRLWMEKGWLDAGMPMNYKREHCSSQASWYRNWIDAALNWRYSRHMYCGQAVYLNSFSNSISQMQYLYGQGADGSMSYSYYATRATETLCDGNDDWVNDWGWYPYVASNLFTTPASLPTMPWRDPATAVEGTMWGRVINWDTGNPVDDATVQLGALPAVRTDGNGYYVVTLAPCTASGRSYALSVTASGPPSANHPAAYVFAGDLSRYDFALGSAAPLLSVAPLSFVREVEHGSNLPEDSFTVAAAGAPFSRGPVNYVVADDAIWLSVSPTYGTSNGELDTLTITYDTTGLAIGSYTAVIFVSDAAADNDPQLITIELQVTPITVPGDFDADGDVDMDDAGHIQECLSGTSTPQDRPECQDAKLDGDSDVDQDDMELFIGCLSGPDIPGDLNCLVP